MIKVNDSYDVAFVDYVISQVSKYFKIEVNEVKGKCRKRELSEARHIVWIILHDEYEFSSFLIAKIFNNNRRSVMSGIANTRFLINNIPNDKRQFDDILKTIEW